MPASSTRRLEHSPARGSRARRSRGSQRPGYSIGAVYSNFGSKERLFVELLSSHVSSRIADAARILDGAADGEDAAQALGRLLVTVAEADVEYAPLRAEYWLYAVRNPEVVGMFAAQLRAQQKALAEVARGGVCRAGSLRTFARARRRRNGARRGLVS